MLVTDRDMEKMESDVIGTLEDWHRTITIKIPKPIAEQPNWNDKLNEFVGEVQYTTHDNISVECIEGYYSKSDADVGGDRDLGSIVLYVPLWYIKDKVKIILNLDADMDMRILYDGDTWRVRILKRLIGEYFLNVYRMVGE